MAEKTEEERVYTIPLREVRDVEKAKRAPYAVKYIKKYIAKHMKTKIGMVWIDPIVNELLWERGRQHPPSKIRIKAVKFEDELVEVSIPEE
ncbi:MAG: 50S ribosomal protein L31e [Thermoplasmata archaeon]